MTPPAATAVAPTPDVPGATSAACFAPALSRRYVLPPLVLSTVVATACVTSFLALAVPLEGKLGEALNPWLDRFLGNAFSATIVVVFLAAAFYALLQGLGVAIDRSRLRVLAGSTWAASPSWLALLSGRPFRPDADADAGGQDSAAFEAQFEAEDRYELQRRRHVDQGLAPLRFVVWVLPLLGFIGTVVGISGSINGLESVIGSDGGGQAAAGLVTVLEGLRFAFDTTLLGLGTVIPVMALLTILERREDDLTGEGCERVRTLLAGSGAGEAIGEPGTEPDTNAPDRTTRRTEGADA